VKHPPRALSFIFSLLSVAALACHQQTENDSKTVTVTVTETVVGTQTQTATATGTVVSTETLTNVVTNTATAVVTAVVSGSETTTLVATLTNTGTVTQTQTQTQTTQVTATVTATATGATTATTTSSSPGTTAGTSGNGTGTSSGTATGASGKLSSVTLKASTRTVSIAGNLGLVATTVEPKAAAKVEFFDGDKSVATVTAYPYTAYLALTAADNGSHSYVAKASDSAGKVFTSDAVSVNVNITGTPPARVANPYAGAKGYVNPEWKAKADGEAGGSRISSSPTGVWMDRMAAIYGVAGGMGLRDHLDAAVAQNATYAQFVIYDLPGRDCAALSSNGELGPTEIDRYMKEYIDPIAGIEGDVAYANLRIINIIEIDSLPNLVTNTGGQAGATPMCDTMKANGNYVKGIQYALSKLHKLPNTYNYVDAAHHGWIGWDTNMGPTAELMSSTAQGADGGFDTVTGFILNTANYSVLSEPYFKLDEKTRSSKWLDWNQYSDELTFAVDFRKMLIGKGFPSSIGMIIDTSRNGWGGPNRPTGPSTSTDPDTMVNASRIDRRIHAGNWCNQKGAGLGERPQVVDKDGIHAYVWIKPPGESDGASKDIANDQGKGFDRMCDPTYGGNGRNKNNMSGALSDAPLSGQWFSAQFQELMANAYPPL
jgi:cellulose 1,4-beta-cellobiosidase